MIEVLAQIAMTFLPEQLIYLMVYLGNYVSASLLTMIPFVPHNLMLIIVLFISIYFMTPFGYGKTTSYKCTGKNKRKTEYSRTIWQSLKDAFSWYLTIGHVINFYVIDYVLKYITS